MAQMTAPRPSRTRYAVEKVRQHWYWGRTSGWKRLIEEDQLNPADRIRLSSQKWAWRRAAGRTRGQARPVYIVGLQRSGTNMVVHGVERAPQVQAHNENDRRAFVRYKLRAPARIRGLILDSRHETVLFKPLCDSHRVDELLSFANSDDARAVWIYRDVDGRTRSALAKFGAHNKEVLTAIATSRAGGMWQAEGLTERLVEDIRSVRPERLDPASAAAMFWYVRNCLFFEQGLHRRDDVHLVSYNAFLAEPADTMRRLCDFIGLEYATQLIAHVDSRRQAPTAGLEIDPGIRKRCDDLWSKLEDQRTFALG